MALPVVTRCRCGELVCVNYGGRLVVKGKGDTVCSHERVSGNCRRCSSPFSVPMDGVQNTATSHLTPIGKLAYDV